MRTIHPEAKPAPKPAPMPAAVDSLMKKAKAVCEETMLDAHLTRAMEQVSANIEHLTPEQRRQLQEIGQIMTLASARPIKGMDQPGKFELHLSDDRLHMLLSVTPPIAGGKPVNARDIIEALRGQGVEKGVMLPEIQKALLAAKGGKEVSQAAVVRGVAARAGKDASIELFGRAAVNRPLEKVPYPDSLKQANLVCIKDDVVALYLPPTPGTPGFDATGKVLEAPPVEDVHLEAGPNVRREEDRFIAQITGMLQVEGDVLSVKPVLLFPHDVIADNDPIHFDGEIMVQGTVRAGVKMVATRDINIYGNVEAAHVESLQGHVRIDQGIVGRGQAVIIAAGDILTKFVESATLRAQGNIHIENGSMHSYLVAGQSIQMTQGKGHLIGGSTLAGQLVAVRILGTPSAVHTEVSVGLSAKAMQVLSKIDIKRRQVQISLEQCVPLLDRIYKMVADPSRLDKASLQTLSNLKQLHFVLQMRKDKYNDRRRRVMADAARDTSGRVDVHEEVQPGVVIRIGNAQLDNKQIAARRQFIYDAQTQRIIGKPLK